MPVKIDRPFGVLSIETIKGFELRNSIELPESYKSFLLESNGGEPTPDVLSVPGWHGQETTLARFYGIHSANNYNLERVLQGSVGVIPPTFLAIGEDAAGNHICIGINGEHKGQIYFWDHEDELDEEGNSKLDMSNMYLLARSFPDFLDSLQSS